MLRSFFITLLLIFSFTSFTKAQRLEALEERDFLLTLLYDVEDEHHIDTVAYLVNLTQYIEEFQGEEFGKLIEYLKLDFKFIYHYLDHPNEFRVSRLSMMYHPRGILEISFEDLIYYKYNKIKLDDLLKLKVKNIKVITWEYEEKDFKNKHTVKPK